ncbi:Uncharacterized protein Fot_55371 [Forsythia ovata]|uniref:Uncharacterized protein n=1 Tax=Forsythia ovata TaxID=205694 RepID=A0ABD1P4K1_9LAMI
MAMNFARVFSTRHQISWVYIVVMPSMGVCNANGLLNIEEYILILVQGIEVPLIDEEEAPKRTIEFEEAISFVKKIKIQVAFICSKQGNPAMIGLWLLNHVSLQSKTNTCSKI